MSKDLKELQDARSLATKRAMDYWSVFCRTVMKAIDDAQTESGGPFEVEHEAKLAAYEAIINAGMNYASLLREEARSQENVTECIYRGMISPAPDSRIEIAKVVD